MNLSPAPLDFVYSVGDLFIHNDPIRAKEVEYCVLHVQRFDEEGETGGVDLAKIVTINGVPAMISHIGELTHENLQAWSHTGTDYELVRRIQDLQQYDR